MPARTGPSVQCRRPRPAAAARLAAAGVAAARVVSGAVLVALERPPAAPAAPRRAGAELRRRAARSHLALLGTGSSVARVPPPAERCRRGVARSAEGDQGPSGPTILEAEIISESNGKKALERLENALEDQIEQAQEGDPEDRIRDLARLLVMAKTAEGIALTATTVEVTGAVQKAVAETLAEFVGKKDYDFDDVSQAVGKKLKNAVGDNGVAIKEATLQMDGAAKAAVASFTGKEKYEFGDISQEIDRRAKDAVNSFTGKDEYEFGDITKEVLKRGGNAVKDFTGREEYQFGDISKTVWKNLFGGDKKEKKR